MRLFPTKLDMGVSQNEVPFFSYLSKLRCPFWYKKDLLFQPKRETHFETCSPVRAGQAMLLLWYLRWPWWKGLRKLCVGWPKA